MDLMRSGKRTMMQTWNADLPPVPVVWFRVPDDTPLHEGPTPFRSNNYDDDPANTGLGEQLTWQQQVNCYHPPYYLGNPPAPYTGDHVCGSPQTWATGGVPGVTPPVVTDTRGVGECCGIGFVSGSSGQASGASGTISGVSGSTPGSYDSAGSTGSASVSSGGLVSGGQSFPRSGGSAGSMGSAGSFSGSSVSTGSATGSSGSAGSIASGGSAGSVGSAGSLAGSGSSFSSGVSGGSSGSGSVGFSGTSGGSSSGQQSGSGSGSGSTPQSGSSAGSSGGSQSGSSVHGSAIASGPGSAGTTSGSGGGGGSGGSAAGSSGSVAGSGRVSGSGIGSSGSAGSAGSGGGSARSSGGSTSSGGSAGSAGSGGSSSTVVSNCCSNPINRDLSAAVAGQGSIPLVWDGASKWQGGQIVTCLGTLLISVECTAGSPGGSCTQLVLKSGWGSAGTTSHTPVSCTCSPLLLTYGTVTPDGTPPGTCPSSFTIVVS